MSVQQKRLFVADIAQGRNVDELFLCKKKSEYVGKTGQPYLSLLLGDRTGDVDAKVWENVEEVSARFEEGDFVRVEAKALLYNGQLQLRVGRVYRVEAEAVDPACFLAVSGNDPKDMFTRLKKIHAALPDPDIRALLSAATDDEDLMREFLRAPAARSIHHSYLGGLIEHTVSVAELGELVCSHYKRLDRSLLQAGILFHDIGKVKELEYVKTIGYSDWGRLVGHLTIGVEILNNLIAGVETTRPFPDQKKMLLTHLILSHHGQHEFGSPKRPKTLEAIVLSALDDLDARIFSFSEILARETKNGRWSSFVKMYDRYLYRWNGPETVPEGRGVWDFLDQDPNEQAALRESMGIDIPGDDDRENDPDFPPDSHTMSEWENSTFAEETKRDFERDRARRDAPPPPRNNEKKRPQPESEHRSGEDARFQNRIPIPAGLFDKFTKKPEEKK